MHRKNLSFLAACAMLLPLLSVNEVDAKQIHIDPRDGSDQNSGLSNDEAFKSFSPLEKMTLEAGDQVTIQPGEFHSSLVINGKGTEEAPIRVSFQAGRYDLFPCSMQTRKLHISNTNDRPYDPKRLAIVLDGAEHIVLQGNGSDIYCRGKMIEVFIESSKNIKLAGLNFDYHRPTVSEFKVLSRTDDRAVVDIHKDSTYKIEDGKLIWVGEGWSFPIGEGGGFQRRETQRGLTYRLRLDVKGLAAKQLEGRKVELTGPNRLGEGDIYQNRQYERDCVGVFQNLSKDIAWENCNLHFLHGMGVVSQFSENITFRNVRIAPRKGSSRTCTAWADMLHFSGCRGDIAVENVFFSGANDDAINVHGTYLAIQEKTADKEVLVRFRHKQTYGFQPFYVDDEVGFIDRDSLTTYATTRVTKVERKSDHDFVVTLADAVPESMELNDVLENRTWTPNLTVTGCTVEHIPTRGFLISTRGKVVVRDNHFIRTPMYAILIAGDCKSWFESGAVTDVLIEGNTFTGCRVINIHPENTNIDAARPVHKNIRIVNNTFVQGGPWLTIVAAKSAGGLEVRGNLLKLGGTPKQFDQDSLVRQEGCSDVICTDNRFEVAE